MIKQRENHVAGYTLVEMLISVSILAIMTVLVVVGQQSYKDSILFTNLAYDVAQTIRERQVEAVSGKEAPGVSLNYSGGYGLYFDVATDNKRFKIYSDYGPTAPRDWRFNDTASEDDLLGTYTLGGGATIQSVCRVQSSDGSCVSSGVTNITYNGPDLGACINDGDSVVNGSSDTNISFCSAASGYSGARIVLLSPGGRTITIEVYSSGQIAVN